MEDNCNEIGRPREIVTLILNNERFETDRQKLIDKSLYFAALLSANYLECGQTEHVVKYEMSSRLLQDFIDWIHKNKIAFASDCEIKFDFETLDRLLGLLELSVLFAADILTSDTTDQIEKYFMLPKYVIDICSLAQELNTNVLRDLSWAVCLDRFDELPLDSIFELTLESFLKLIGNINIRTTESYVLSVARMWMKYHNDFKISLDTLKNEKSIILPSIISCESNNTKQFIHSWDGNDFFELTSFEYPIDIMEHCRSYGKNIEGMQITARRYDIYLCGGEYGIGSERFNKNIWRYSLISKKWSLVTVMPGQRRHMIAVFLKNKLVLVGGVGQYRQQLQTIDIYDIHTDTWRTSHARMSLQFTSVPDYFIYNDKLIIHQYLPALYIYHPEEDVWETRSSQEKREDFPTNVPIVTLSKPMSCYIDIDQDRMILRTVTETCNVKDCNEIVISIGKTYTYIGNRQKRKYYAHIDGTLVKRFENWFSIVPFYRNNHRQNNPSVMLYTDFRTRDTVKKLHLHSIPIRNPAKFRSLAFKKNTFSTSKFFNLLHPAYLYTTNSDHLLYSQIIRYIFMNEKENVNKDKSK